MPVKRRWSALTRQCEIWRCSLQRVQEELQPKLTRYAIEELLRHLRESGDLKWPAARMIQESQRIDRLSSRPKYGRWLVENPSLEDVTQLSQDVARHLDNWEPLLT